MEDENYILVALHHNLGVNRELLNKYNEEKFISDYLEYLFNNSLLTPKL